VPAAAAEGFATRLVLGPALRAQPDRRLVTLVREGYETAFEEIVRRYGRPLTRYAASIVGGRSEDVTQDAFSKALLALRRDDAEIELRPWLFRIVRNTALNDLRDSPPSPEVLAEVLAGGGDPVDELERREELADLMKRLQALPEPQRAAIVMRELEGLGHDEIAAALGLSGGGARQAIYRARQALREGAGMLLPLPLLRAMLEGGGPGAAEVTAGTAGIGGAAGAGVALKATAATVLVAGAVGAGVALKDNSRSGEATAAPVRTSQSRAQAASVSAPATREASSDYVRHESDGGSRGAFEGGEDRGGPTTGRVGADGGSFGAGEKLQGGTEPEGGDGRGPSHSGSSGHEGGPGHGSDDSGREEGGSGASGRLGSGGGSGSGEEGSNSGNEESSPGSGEDSNGGSGSAGETVEGASSGDGSGADSNGSDDSGSSDGGGDGESASSGSGEALRDLQDGGGLTE
jgi:RNA polymerase sigma factor (sigma-70 family)